MTQIDIDDEALAATMQLSGVRTKKEAVNLALREYAAVRRRGDARLRHFAVAGNWDDSSFWRDHREEKTAAE